MKYFTLIIYLITIFIILSSGSCATLSNLEHSHSFLKGNNYSILVIGVEPRYRIHISRGCDMEQKWKLLNEFGAAANVFPEEGYVVVKLRPRNGKENYGIPSIMPKGISGVFGGNIFKACNGNLVPVFELPPDQVVYVGHVKYIKTEDDKLTFGISKNFTAAQEFIDMHYPNLSKDLIQGEITLKEIMNVDCRPDSIPIVIVM